MSDQSETWEEAAAQSALCVPIDHTHVPNQIDKLAYIDQLLTLLREFDTFVPNDTADFNEAIEIARIFVRIADAALPAPGDGRSVALNNTVQTITKKQYDYGHDNILWGGLQGIVLRMHDKTARIRNLEGRVATEPLSQKGFITPRNEALEDSWLDLVGYSIIGIMYVDKSFELPLARDVKPKVLPEEQWPPDIKQQVEAVQLPPVPDALSGLVGSMADIGLSSYAVRDGGRLDVAHTDDGTIVSMHNDLHGGGTFTIETQAGVDGIIVTSDGTVLSSDGLSVVLCMLLGAAESVLDWRNTNIRAEVPKHE